MSIQNMLGNLVNASRQTKRTVGDESEHSISSMIPGGLAGGAIAGGVMALLLGGKSTRKMAKKVAKYGGTAVLGGLAYKAYDNWQQNKALGQTRAVSDQDIEQAQLAKPAFFAEESSNQPVPFAMTLIKTMIAASKADGNIDAAEHQRLFDSIEQLKLSSEEKSTVFGWLGQEITVPEIVAAVSSAEQKAEVYLAAYLAIEVDDQRERAFLNNLAIALELPQGFPAYLEQQADSGIEK